MSTLQNLPELNILPNRKRDIGSKTPTLTTHTHLYNDPDQKKAETLDQSRITGNALEMPDIGQQQRPKSAIRLTKSPTGSTSSYKSSSITGPQETQESMTFAISEIANKVSKSTFSGEEHEEEESTAQFEPPKPKTFKEPNDDKRTQAFQTAISIANSKPNYSPLSVNQTGGWKAVVQKIQNQGSRNMTNQQAQPERVSTPAHPSSKGITMSKGLSSLIEACNVKNTTNFVKVSFQQQLNIPPKSPIRPSGGFVQNISLMSSVGQLNKNDQVSKDLVKEPAGMERLNKTTPVPSFKDYLQKYKGSTSAATNPMKQSAETFKSPQTPLNIKTSFEMPPKRVAEANTDSNRLAIEDENKALENAKLTPHRRSDENLKENKGFMTAEFKTNAEKTVNTPHPLRQTFGHQTIISTTFKSPKFQIINQIAMPSSTDKEKAQTNLKGYTNVKGSSTRKTHLVPELPIISEVPEIDLKAKKIVNQYKQDRQSAKSSQNSAQFDQLLEIGSESSASQDESESDESEGEDESNETSESIGQGRALNQVQNQNVRKIEFTMPRIPERNNDTQATSEVLECEESEEGDEEGSSSSGSYYEVEEDSSETGIETQKVEKPRSACIDDTFKEHMINNSQSKAESEYEEQGNWDYEDGGGSSECQLTEEEFESPEGRQAQAYQIEAGREKPQQFNQKLVYKPGVDNPVRQMERYRGHNAQVYEEEDVLRNRAMNENIRNFDEQRDVFFKHSTMSSTDLILKKYSEIEYRVWDLKGKQWMFDKEVRILQVSMKSLNERIDSLFDLAEGKPSKKDVVLSLTSSELNQIFEDNSQC